MNRIRFSLTFLIFSLFCSAMAQQAYIIAANGERVNVEKILARPDGALVITINGQPRDLARDQYVQAVGVKPEGFDAVIAELQVGDYDTAAPPVQEIIRESAYQSWDVIAGKALIEAALQEDNMASARRIYDQLSTRYGDDLLAVFPELQISQWQLRIAEGSTSGLEDELTRVLREEERRVTRAQAQIARGDLKRRRKDFSSAVLDYLRAVYFYSDLQDEHAEALYKTAATFAQIGDTGRLRKYQMELKETYPDSRFSAMSIDN